MISAINFNDKAMADNSSSGCCAFVVICSEAAKLRVENLALNSFTVATSLQLINNDLGAKPHV